MKITRVQASNWRNFKSIDFAVENRVFIVGPNAAGKSNLLDLFRFLGDITSDGGGLASAIESRGGLSKVRSLFARNFQGGRLRVELSVVDGDDDWTYELAIKGQKGGRNKPIVHRERVICNGEVILDRPDDADRADEARLTQTHLEQISANQKFRTLADFFARVSYFHLVPQIIRNPGGIPHAASDPFGADFITAMNSLPKNTQRAWFRRVEAALQSAIPEFESLRLDVDAAGRPHLIAGYRNWRQSPARQNEVDFSDGTLRLIGLLWTMVSAPANGGVLLMEEPELSLNSAIVRTLPTALAMTQRGRALQVFLSTHAPEILDDEGIRAAEVLVLRVTTDGSQADILSDIREVGAEIDAGLPLSDVVAGLIEPRDLSGLVTAGRRK